MNTTVKIWGTLKKDSFLNMDDFEKYPEHLSYFEVDVKILRRAVEKYNSEFDEQVDKRQQILIN